MTYQVFVDDNFHYQDLSERTLEGMFATPAEAIAVCKAIVDDWIAGALRPGMSPEALWEQYTLFGDDPFVVPVDTKASAVAFNAWDYARRRCVEVVDGSQ